MFAAHHLGTQGGWEVMEEREALFMVYQFLKHPPTVGACISINLEAWNDLLNIVHGALGQDTAQQPTTQSEG
jgi:hypothetical protein